MPLTQYELWMSEVDQIVQERTGLSVYDLPDVAYRVMFEDGITAEEMANIAIESAD